MNNEHIEDDVVENKQKEKAVPFFARFLEDQRQLKVKTNVKAGATLKYPSDRDEWQ